MESEMDVPGQRSAAAPDEERERLRTLVGELLESNEKLRMKVTALEENLSAAGAVYRLLIP